MTKPENKQSKTVLFLLLRFFFLVDIYYQPSINWLFATLMKNVAPKRPILV